MLLLGLMVSFAASAIERAMSGSPVSAIAAGIDP